MRGKLYSFKLITPAIIAIFAIVQTIDSPTKSTVLAEGKWHEKATNMFLGNMVNNRKKHLKK